MKYFLSIKIGCSSQNIPLSQRKYILIFLMKLESCDAKPANSFIDPNTKLDNNKADLLSNDDRSRRLVGG